MLTTDQIREKARTMRSMKAATIDAYELDEIANTIDEMKTAIKDLIDAKNGPVHRWVEAKHQAEYICER